MHSIYIIVGIISNLEMIQTIQEDVYRLYANTTPCCIRDLGIFYVNIPGGPGTSLPWTPKYNCIRPNFLESFKHYSQLTLFSLLDVS